MAPQSSTPSNLDVPRPKRWWRKISRGSQSQDSSNVSDSSLDPGSDASSSRPYTHEKAVGTQGLGTSSLARYSTNGTRTLRIQTSRESRQIVSASINTPDGHSRSGSRSRRAIHPPSQEQTAHPADLTRLKAGEVLTNLIVSYDREIVEHFEGWRVEYEEDTAFEELDTMAMDKLREHQRRRAETFYLKKGRCRLLRHDTNKVAARLILESQREWNDDLPPMIMAFRGQNPHVKFHIELEWEFSSLQISKIENQPYAETVCNAIDKKIERNWEGRLYIPQKDLKKIVSRDTIFELVKEDESLYDGAMMTSTGGKAINRDDFVTDVWKWASRLLALCIYVGLPLACLYKMRKNGIEDENLPLSEQCCPESCYRVKFRLAAMISGGFKAHTFELNDDGELEHLELNDGAVVPIVFHKNRDALGQGSFGRVYKVQIDGDHHSFSTLEDEHFALKIFFDRSSLTIIGFEHEAEILAKLARRPHPNITTHLASWKQKGTCYMLFRCANFNLRSYMKQPSPRLTKDYLLGLLSQMKGLADGLRHIHNLGPSNLEPGHIDENPTSKRSHHGESCFHHDLKPENILVSLNPDTGELLFSISDFGSARIGEILSGSLQPSHYTKNLSQGDTIYSAPDYALTGKTSRPYDLWSMGCILLELFTWILDLEDANLKRFAERRVEVSNMEGNQDQAFWYKDGSGKVQLKPAVTEHMKMLKEKCDGRGVFPTLLRTIGKLLTLLPLDRPEASQLSNALDALIIQAQEDLIDENFYIDKKATQVLIAAPPSSVGDSDSQARRPSIDESKVFARFGDTLLPSPNSHRRSTIGSLQPHGTRRPNFHARHQSSPEADANTKSHPSLEIDTRIEPESSPDPEEQPTTPRLSISDYDNDSARKEVLMNTGSSDELIPPIGSHNSYFTTRLEKKRSSDSQVLDSD